MRKLDIAEQNLKSKEKTIQLLQNDIKLAKIELKESKIKNQCCQDELD